MRYLPPNMPRWRLFLKEDYQPGKSLFVLKIHHSMTDGYGITSLMLNLVDNSTFNGDSLKHLTTKPSTSNILKYLSLPYHMAEIFLRNTFTPLRNNPLTKQGITAGGFKKVCLSKEYSVAKIKGACKVQGTTVNDFLMTAISLTLK